MEPHPVVCVKDLRPGLKNITMVLITLEIGKPSTTKDGHEVRSIRVADRTGCVNLSIWDEPGTLLQPGDIIRVHKAYASLFKNSLTLYIGKGGEIYKVGDFCLHFSETPNMSEESFVNPAAEQGIGGGPSPSAGRGPGGPGGPSSDGKLPPMMGGPRGERPQGGGGYGGNNNAGQRMAPLGVKGHLGMHSPVNHYNNNFHHGQAGHMHHGHHSHVSIQPDQVVTPNGVKLHRK